MTIIITTVAILLIVGGFISGVYWGIYMMYASETHQPKLSDYLVAVVPLAFIASGVGLLIWRF